MIFRRPRVGHFHWTVASFLLAAPAIGAVAPPPGGVLPEKFERAASAFAAGRYAECRAGFVAAGREAKRAGLAARAFYGAACCAALADTGGDPEAAFEALALAVSNGYRERERAAIDPRLESLHGDGRWLPFLKLVEEQEKRYRAGLNAELITAYDELLADRGDSRTTADQLRARATGRRALALALVDRGRLKEPGDYFHAAALLAESAAPEEVSRARALAHRALELDPDLLLARPVYATALDRERRLAGEPQLFGTQLVYRDGAWAVDALDAATTDAERAAWGLPPIAELEARAAGLPAPSPPPPAPTAAE